MRTPAAKKRSTGINVVPIQILPEFVDDALKQVPRQKSSRGKPASKKGKK